MGQFLDLKLRIFLLLKNSLLLIKIGKMHKYLWMKKVELIQQKLRIVSAEFQKMGPEINLGWEKPIATK
jgi:hypothetical protein